MHDKRQIGFAAWSQHTRRRETRVVDERRIFIAHPLDGIRRVRHNGFEWLFVPVLRRSERIVALDIKLIKTYIVQEHIDTAEVVGGEVDLLTIETITHILFAEDLGELQQQRTRTAGRVIDFVHLFFAHEGQAAKQIADLLRCEELTTRLACAAGVHGHKKLISITKSVNAVVLVVTQLHVADTVKELAEFLVAFREGGAQLRAIDIHIGKESSEIAFAVCTLCTLLDGAESILKGDIEVLVVLGTTAHIAEQLAWEDKEALFLYQSRTCKLCLRIRKQRIIEIGIARLVFALVDIVSEVLADIAIEHDAQHILFEVPAVHATS